ncbi:large ribosomal subunit protein mL46 [Aplochiton taeniatus]
MAAPGGRFASRPLLHTFIKSISRTGVNKTGDRHISRSNVCRASLQVKNKTDNVASPWTKVGAVCLQRLRVVSQDRSRIEEQFAELMSQMELEQSLVSDHEQRLLEDAERMRRKQADDYDSDEEDDYGGQEIVTAQDLEDTWEQRLKQFEPAPRTNAGDVEDFCSLGRCLTENLVLLVEQMVGREKIWLLPQLQWEEGETLRQTAEKALTIVPEADFKATFLGHAPCGVYKYKFPKELRTESCIGAKVFFFKAILSGNSHSPAPKGPFMWVKKSELKDYLKPAYFEKVNCFILNL